MDEQTESQAATYEGRRATLEDLPELRSLWQKALLPVSELEKRFTEFQLIRDGAGRVVAAIGLHMEGGQGNLHSEVYANPGDAPTLRPMLWERIVRLAKNNGLLRLWTPATVHFYREQGMIDVDDATRPKIPPGFGSPNADWLVLKLRDENHAQLSLDQEFAIFTEQQKSEAEQVKRQAQVFKLVAYLLLMAVLLALGVLAYIVFFRLRR